MMKKPGRVEKICSKCEQKFSTHSSNRQSCHKCAPKCRERHYFNEGLKKPTEKFEKIDERKQEKQAEVKKEA